MESKAFHTICIQLPSRFCVVPARLDTGEAFTVSVGKDIDADGQSNWKFSCSIRIIRCVIDAQCEWSCFYFPPCRCLSPRRNAWSLPLQSATRITA